MATQVKIAGTGANDATPGGQAWTSPGNITADDAANASNARANSAVMQYLKATNFGFTIPTGATINGITVEVERLQSSAQQQKDVTVKIVKADGTFGSQNKADTSTAWPTVATIKTYGSASDLWGETWTPADINDIDFGLIISATNSTGVSNQAQIDFIRITVTYTSGGEGSGDITSLGAGAQASGTSPATLQPGLPAGLAAGDLMVAIVAYAGDGNAFTLAASAGWNEVLNVGNNYLRLLVASRAYVNGAGNDVFTCTAGGPSAGMAADARILGFRGVDGTTPVLFKGTAGLNSGVQDISVPFAVTPSQQDVLALLIGAKRNLWTSVATLTGDGLTWNELVDESVDATTQDVGLVVGYAKETTIVPFTDKTFTVTGGAANRTLGVGLLLKPGVAAAPAGTKLSKVRAGGSFSTKVMKVRAGGSFSTKPVKLISGGIPPPPPPPGPDVGMSADQLLMWGTVNRITALTDANLDSLKANGFGGFVITLQQLKGLGGVNDYTGDPLADLTQAKYANQQAIVSSNIVARLAQRGMKCYMGWWSVNYAGTTQGGRAPMYKDWFSDAIWHLTTGDILPKITDIAAAAKLLGMTGIYLDSEEYGGRGTWEWDYTGNTQNEATTRAKVATRAAAIMSAILAQFPNADIIHYHPFYPGSWKAQQNIAAGLPNDYTKSTEWNFMSGMTSTHGYKSYKINSTSFQKTYGSGSPTETGWKNAMKYEMNYLMAFASQNFLDWAYANDKFYWMPFAWLNADPANSPFADAPSLQEATDQLAAMHKVGMGRILPVFNFGGIVPSFYNTYTTPLLAAALAEFVDFQPPVLDNIVVGGSTITGTATDDVGVRAVRWKDNLGGTGVAVMTFVIDTGAWNNLGTWHMDWTFPKAALTGGATSVTITVEDTHLLTTSTTVSV